jgi:hypothetical protein
MAPAMQNALVELVSFLKPTIVIGANVLKPIVST